MDWWKNFFCSFGGIFLTGSDSKATVEVPPEGKKSSLNLPLFVFTPLTGLKLKFDPQWNESHLKQSESVHLSIVIRTWSSWPSVATVKVALASSLQTFSPSEAQWSIQLPPVVTSPSAFWSTRCRRPRFETRPSSRTEAPSRRPERRARERARCRRRRRTLIFPVIN